MQLTPEQQTIGRRNFLKAVAGVPALAGLGTAAALKGPVRGGPVRMGFIGLGGEGRVLLAQVDPAYRAPSLYDESLRLLARHGLPVPADRLERDWTQPYEPSDGVEADPLASSLALARFDWSPTGSLHRPAQTNWTP